MSASALLNPNTGTLLPQYLPQNPDPHPYIENPFVSPVDGGNQPITNLASLLIGATGVIPVGLGLSVIGSNLFCDSRIAVAQNKFISDDGSGNFEITNSTVGGKLNFQGPAGVGEVFDSVNNPPAVQDTTVVQQIPGTISTFVIPPTGSPVPAKTLATFTISGSPKNSYIVYLKLNTGTLTTPDGTPYVFQYFLSDTVDGNIDETKGCLVGYTNPISNGASDFQPNTTLLYRPTSGTNTIYLNVQSLPSTPHSGCTWTNPIWTADVYASEI